MRLPLRPVPRPGRSRFRRFRSNLAPPPALQPRLRLLPRPGRSFFRHFRSHLAPPPALQPGLALSRAHHDSFVRTGSMSCARGARKHSEIGAFLALLPQPHAAYQPAPISRRAHGTAGVDYREPGKVQRSGTAGVEYGDLGQQAWITENREKYRDTGQQAWNTEIWVSRRGLQRAGKSTETRDSWNAEV